jgi:NAD(P)-dependent dehydrogenase (short-subunit alcohol dehydrogenase family)
MKTWLITGANRGLGRAFALADFAAKNGTAVFPLLRAKATYQARLAEWEAWKDVSVAATQVAHV